MGRKNDRLGRKFEQKQPPKETDWNRMFGIKEEKSQWKTELEPTPNEKEEFKKRLAVENMPEVKEKKSILHEYPEDAVILAIGPTNNGKTEKMKELFGEEAVYCFNDMVYKDAGISRDGIKTKQQKKEIRDAFFEQMEKVINEVEQPIVIDANFCLKPLRLRMYNLIKNAGKTLFIVTYSIPYKQAHHKIEKKYTQLLQEVNEEIIDRKAKGEDISGYNEKYQELKRYRKKAECALKSTYDSFAEFAPFIEKEISENGLNNPDYVSQVRRIKGNLEQEASR